VTDSAGVPSVAKIVKVEVAAAPAAPPITGYQGRCVAAQNASSADGTPLVMATCNGRAEQQWTASGADASLRTLGKCMSVRGWIWSGSRVTLSACNGGNAQRWVRRTDGTIRVQSSTGLCLSVVGRSTANGAALEVRSCNGGAYQRWS
jgi:hypothetical protein